MFSDSEKAELREIVNEAINAHNKDTLDAIHEELDKSKWTKEKILAVKDRRQRQKLISQHMELFR